MTAENFSVQYIVLEDQYLDDSILFGKVFVLAQDGDDEETMDLYSIPNDDPDMIIQVSDGSYNYTLDYGVLENRLRALHGQEKELVKNSFIYIQAWYNSSSLMYELEHEPFNYKYLGDEHDAYHIGLYINGELIAYSNESLFNDYIEKIEDGYIYFNERNETDPGYITPQSEIMLAYKYKLQPGLLDRKHFLIVVYPWSNVFEETLEYSDSPMLYREKYRKLSGGSIIAPFEYSLSIDEKYSLYLAYRLNKRNYMEEKFKFDHASRNFKFSYLGYGLENFVSEMADGDDIGLTVYYFDENGRSQILDHSHYDVDLENHEITLKDDGNAIVTPNSISEFYVSFTPKTQDREIPDYEFSYDPRYNITKTIKLSHWTIEGSDSIIPIPNLDAFNYIVENESNSKLITCRASQIVGIIENGTALMIDLEGELNDFNPEMLTALHQGNFNKLHIRASLKYLEAISGLKIELHDANGLMDGFTQVIDREKLEMLDHEIIISLPKVSNSLKSLKFIPIFRTDGEYTIDNARGILRTETIEWDEDKASAYPDGNVYMQVELKNELKDDQESGDLVLMFNDELKHLETLKDIPINYSVEEDGTSFVLIPKKYFDPEINENLSFKEGDLLVIKYYSPINRYLVATIGNMFFEYKGYNNDMHPDIPKAELLLVNANSSSSFEDFLSDYYLQVPLESTPFETEFNNKFKVVKIELNITSLFKSVNASELFFSHLIFSVPDPSYELTISDVILIRESDGLATSSDSIDERIWQYTEVEIFKSSPNPEQDVYELSLDNEPLFYPDDSWLDLVNVYDEDGNYYSVGLSGDDHQLHYDPSTHALSWNPSFNQFPEYFGFEFEEPLIIDPNKTLYFEYATNTSWRGPFRIKEANVDVGTIILTFDDIFLLRPEYFDWYPIKHDVPSSYEYISYSFQDESDYRVVQYLIDSFTVYSNVSEITRELDIGEYSLIDDFDNVSLYQVVGTTPTLDTVEMLNDIGYEIEFNATAATVKIMDLNASDGLLDQFEMISIILNYSCGPISSYTEIYLLDAFNETYLEDVEETFYNSIQIYYNHVQPSGDIIFGEISNKITSEDTSFEPISFNRNPDISNDYSLNNHGSELFDNFEIHEDESVVILITDSDMDGVPEYKQLIDVNKDGTFEIIRYGTVDPDDSENIIWYLTMQEFASDEVKLDRYLEEEMRTKWFDLDDRTFAHYDFNVLKLISLFCSGPLFNIFILQMLMPEVDYWAQKSVQREVIKEEHRKNVFYSVIADENKDGNIDFQINYESTKISINYTVTEYKKTLLAARYQDPLFWLLDYAGKSFEALLTGKKTDSVFNNRLTPEMIESGNFTSCNIMVKLNAGILKSSYRKFTENVTMQYTDSFDHSQITIMEYGNDGEIMERRTYTDEFDTGEIDNVEQYFGKVMEEHSIIVMDDDVSLEIDFDPEFPISDPINGTWNSKTWGTDNIPIKYDNLKVEREDESYSDNAFMKTVILRIPNRFSLYNDYKKISRESVKNDGWVELEATGVLIQPQDGLVYYTSDLDSFNDGTARTKGYYFYVDSDKNGFYETVYVLKNAVSQGNGNSQLQAFDVISICLNQDGLHDVAPYEKIKPLSKDIVTDYGDLESEKKMFGDNWLYVFAALEREPALGIGDDPNADELLKVKDLFFETYKLVEMSDENPRFPELFHEIRHEQYSRAWEQYRQQLASDIFEQVVMTVTASIISTAVEALLSSTVVLAPIAKAMAHLAYFTVYSLMSKFFIDMKMRKAEALQASLTFHPKSYKSNGPISLNEKSSGDSIIGDSMTAALAGHPGGYYTLAKGTANGKTYQAQVLVTPPRVYNLIDERNFFNALGFLRLLGENLISMGESDPDSFTALDFFDTNLDYFMLTSELPSYNWRLNHEIKLNDPFGFLKDYSANSLGYLENRIKTISRSSLTDLVPSWVLTPSGNLLQYEFVDGISRASVMPLEVLYKPIVISKDRYSQLNPKPLELVVNARVDGLESTFGLSSSELNDLERKVYSGKISLMDGAFNYPIKSVSVDIMETRYECVPQVIPTENGWHIVEKYEKKEAFLAKSIALNETEFVLDGGNLYFKRPLFELVSEKFPDLRTVSEEYSSVSSGTYSPKLTYKVHIVFDPVVSDDSDEAHELALAQATSYVILDYFNQYFHAQISANMISEIAYTETVTFWSTLISAPLAFLGSYTVAALKTYLAQAGGKVVQSTLSKAMSMATSDSLLRRLSLSQIGLRFVGSAISEVFQEIVIDDLIETIVGSLVAGSGGSQELNFWLSTIATSIRESLGPLDRIRSMGMKFQDRLDIIHDKIMLNLNARNELRASLIFKKDLKMEHALELNFDLLMNLQKLGIKRLLTSGVLKSALLMVPSLFFGSIYPFTFLSSRFFDSCNRLFSEMKTRIFLRKVNFYISLWKVPLHEALIAQVKSPSDISYNDLYKMFRKEFYPLILSPPILISFPDIRLDLQANVKSNLNDIRYELVEIFNSKSVGGFLENEASKQGEDQEAISIKADIEATERNVRKIDFEDSKEERVEELKENLNHENGLLLPSQERYINEFTMDEFDPHVILCMIKAGQKAKYGQEIMDYKIPAGFSKRAMIEDLQALFDVSVDLDFVTDKGERIDDDESDVKAWLEKRKYKEDVKLVVVPKDVIHEGQGIFQFEEKKDKKEEDNKDKKAKEKIPSPYLPIFDRFFNNLKRLLYSFNLFPNKEFEDVTMADVSRYAFFYSSDSGLFSDKLKYLKKNPRGKIFESTLFKWHSAIIVNAFEKIEDQYGRDQFKQKLDKLFEWFYKCFGYIRPARYYIKAKLSVYITMKIFFEHNKLKTNQFQRFLTLLGFEVNTFGTKCNNPDYKFNKDTHNLYSRIRKYLQSIGVEEQEIKDIINEIEENSHFNEIFKKFEERIGSKNPAYRNTIFWNLIENIKDCPATDILQRISSSDLSKILFNHPSYDQEGGKFYNKYSYLEAEFFKSVEDANNIERTYALWAILIRASQLKLKDFEKIGLKDEINNEELIALKKHIKKTIFDFFKVHGHFKDARIRKYNNDRTNEARIEFFYKVILAAAIFAKKNFITRKKVLELLGLSEKVNYFEGRTPTEETLDNLKEKVNEFIKHELTSEKQVDSNSFDRILYYIDALNAIEKYEAELKFCDKLKEMKAEIDAIIRRQENLDSEGYALEFSNRYYRSWNIIVQLCDLLSTDPLSLDDLKDDFFDKDTRTGIYDIHHIIPNHKESLALYEHILTSGYRHNYYKYLTVKDQKFLKRGLRKLIWLGIEGKGSGRDGLINERDIRKVFGNHRFTIYSDREGEIFNNVPIISTIEKGEDGKRKYVDGLWDYHFSADFKGFKDKLNRLNDKIRFIRDEKGKGLTMRQVYMNYLEEFHGDHAYPRFYGLAETYASRLRINAHLLMRGYNGFKLRMYGRWWHFYLTRLLFRLQVPIDHFLQKS
ncbi:MAG: hypothetical protein ACTSQ8_20065 [Candidatus Helarchaeota archaeon]